MMCLKFTRNNRVYALADYSGNVAAKKSAIARSFSIRIPLTRPVIYSCFLLSALLHLGLFLTPAPHKTITQNNNIILVLESGKQSDFLNQNGVKTEVSGMVGQTHEQVHKAEKDFSNQPGITETRPASEAPIVASRKQDKKKLPPTPAASKKRGGKTGSKEKSGQKNQPEDNSEAKEAPASYSPPKPVTGNTAPEYPKLARKRNQQGLVILRCFIDSKGKAAKVELNKSSGHKLLDEAAMKAVKDWNFIPARKNDQPYGEFLLIPIQFNLNSR